MRKVSFVTNLARGLGSDKNPGGSFQFLINDLIKK